MSNLLPEVAEDAATLCVGSDRYPLTIVEKSAKTLKAKHDLFKMAEGGDWFGNQIWE